MYELDHCAVVVVVVEVVKVEIEVVTVEVKWRGVLWYNSSAVSNT